MKRVGYTTGVFDLFHVGHLNLLAKARETCDHLIVGVTTDELAVQLKGRPPVVPFEERFEIIQGLRYVDQVVAEASSDKLAAWERLRFDVICKGDDWKGTPQWVRLEEEFAARGVEVRFFPYTRHTSSTVLRNAIDLLLTPQAV